MARGFGSTLGVGAGDRIVSSCSDNVTLQSISMCIYRRTGAADSKNFITQWDYIGYNNFYQNANKYCFIRKWTTHDGQWSISEPTTGIWNYIGISYDGSSASNQPSIYVNGNSQSVTTTDVASGSLYDLSGTPYCFGNSLWGADSWDGMLAECAIWNCILTPVEFASLAKGISPLLIRPELLVEYIPMIRDVVSHKKPISVIDISTVLLLHMNGTDANTTFTDATGRHSVTSVVGNAQIDTAQSKFGGASFYSPDYTSCIRLDGNSDFAFGTGDFTIDFWIRFQTIPAVWSIMCDWRDAQADQPCLTLNGTDHKWVYHTNALNRITSDTAPTTDTWYHVALTRSGTNTKLFIDGNQVGTTYTDTTNYTVAANRPQIGSQVNGTNGWIDEFRVIKGYAAWTSNFTPPTAPYNPISVVGTTVQPHPRIIQAFPANLV